ncbi:MAG: DUF4214 domain-containing protein, partial [Deltaproteobacteria bacterium]|nr:DUF4214 domain-containing protein [Deltaproteobacteria bacterium]
GDDGGIGPVEDYPPFCARVSTQTINPRYAFTGDTRLVETAKRMQAAGFDSIKIQADLPNGPNGYCLDALSPPASSPADLLARDPSYQYVLNANFNTYSIWINAAVNWGDGLSVSEQTTAYTRMYQAACYLLTNYQNTSKTFLLGNWEGDWLLKGQAGPSCSQPPEPSQTRIQGMIDWLNTRADGVIDARTDCGGPGVNALSYAEVNCVPAAMSGLPRMTNEVLPEIHVDAISYSAYDVQGGGDLGQMKQNITAALDFIRLNATGAAKDYIYIGEYGFPYNESGWDAPARELRTAAMFEAAAGWGCQHVLWWQVFDNECECSGAPCTCNQTPDSCRGFWLIDNSNNTVAVYDMHREYISKAHVFKNLYRWYLKRNPDQPALNSFGGTFRTFNPSLRLNAFINSAEYHNLITDADYVTLLFQDLLMRDPGPAEITTYTGMARPTALEDVMNGVEAQSVVSNEQFIDHLYDNMLGRAASAAERSARLSQLQNTPRSTLWREVLNSQEFRLRELNIRNRNQHGDIVIKRKYWFDY